MESETTNWKPGVWEEVSLFAVVFLAAYLLAGYATGPIPWPGAVVALVLALAGTYAARRGLVQPVFGYEAEDRFYTEAVLSGGALVVALVIGGVVAGAADLGSLAELLVVPLAIAAAAVAVKGHRRRG